MQVFDINNFIAQEAERNNLYKYTKEDLMKDYQNSFGDDRPDLSVRGKGNKTYRGAVTEKKPVNSAYAAFAEVFSRKGSLLVGDRLFKAYIKVSDEYLAHNISVSELGETFYVKTAEDGGVVRFGEGYPVVKKIK